MAHVLVRHKVKDYAKWKPVFDEHAAMRKTSGSKGGHVFRSADDPNEVLVLLEWESLQKARQFVESQDLRAAMDRAGVSDRPDVYFMEDVDHPRS